MPKFESTDAGVSPLPRFSKPFGHWKNKRNENETFEEWTERNVNEAQQMEHDEDLRRAVAEFIS